MKKISIASIAAIASLMASGQTPSETPTITDRLNSSESVRVIHPDALQSRLVPAAPKAASETVDENAPESADDETAVRSSNPRRIGGYRVQIFSDNNVRTAKAEAKRKARAVADAFPKYPTYVVFTSPYWRLKVGDFKTQDEAEVAATEIKRAFPAYAKEIRVVRDRINASK